MKKKQDNYWDYAYETDEIIASWPKWKQNYHEYKRQQRGLPPKKKENER